MAETNAENMNQKYNTNKDKYNDEECSARKHLNCKLLRQCIL